MSDDRHANRNAPPLNPLPPVVWLLALPMIAIEIVLSLGARGLIGGPKAVGWRLDMLEHFAFSPDLMRYMVETRQFPLDDLARMLTYPFVHGNITHVLFVVVILLALGKFVGEVFRWWALLAVFFASSVVGALVFVAVPAIRAPLFGGYPAVYGLIGAFTFRLWVRRVGSGGNQYRAFSMIGFLMLMQLLFGVLFGGGWDWVADLSGFAAGFVLSFVVAPGGWARVRERLRQR